MSSDVLRLPEESAGENPLQAAAAVSPGVGQARAALLEKLDLRTVEDVLWRLPRDVLDLSQVKSPADLVEGELQTVRGIVAETDGGKPQGNARGHAARLRRRLCAGPVVQPAVMRQKMAPGTRWLFSGKPKKKEGAGILPPRLQPERRG